MIDEKKYRQALILRVRAGLISFERFQKELEESYKNDRSRID